MKTKFKGLGLRLPATSDANTQGRPSKRDIVKNPPRQPSNLGVSNWLKSTPGKVSIKGGQK